MVYGMYNHFEYVSIIALKRQAQYVYVCVCVCVSCVCVLARLSVKRRLQHSFNA